MANTYNFDSELPSTVQALPRHARRVWKSAYNARVNDNDPATIEHEAWNEVLKKYEQTDEGWRMAKSTDVDPVQHFTKFAQLVKVDAGNKLIWYRIASETPDRDGEIMDYESSKPNFLSHSQRIEKMTRGKSKFNVREMHKNESIGVAREFIARDDHKDFLAGVELTDPVALQKYAAGNYAGASIGGSYGRKWADAGNPKYKRYTAVPIEFSLVDVPNNPDAGEVDQFELVKADGTVEMRKFVIANDGMEKGFSRPPSRRPATTKQPMKRAGVKTPPRPKSSSVVRAPAKRSSGLTAKSGVGYRKMSGTMEGYMAIAEEMLKGDVVGHEFHGNQYSSGSGNSGEDPRDKMGTRDKEVSIGKKVYSDTWVSDNTKGGVTVYGKRKDSDKIDSLKSFTNWRMAAGHHRELTGDSTSVNKGVRTSTEADELAEQLIKVEGGGGSAIRLLQTMRNNAEMTGNFEAAENLTQAIQLAMAAGESLAGAAEEASIEEEGVESPEGDSTEGDNEPTDEAVAEGEGEPVSVPPHKHEDVTGEATHAHPMTEGGDSVNHTHTADGEVKAAASEVEGDGSTDPAAQDEEAKKKAALYRGIGAGKLRKNHSVQDVHEVIHALSNMAAANGDDLAVRVSALYDKGAGPTDIAKALGINSLAKAADLAPLAKASEVRLVDQRVTALVKDLAKVVEYVENQAEVITGQAAMIEKLSKATIHGPALREITAISASTTARTVSDQIREAQANGQSVGVRPQ